MHMSVCIVHGCQAIPTHVAGLNHCCQVLYMVFSQKILLQ